MSAPRSPWQPTRALVRGLGLTGLALLAAAVLGQLELVLVVVPLALGTAISLARVPDRLPPAELTVAEQAITEGGPVRGRVTVTNQAQQRLLTVVSAAVPVWIRLRHGVGSYASVVAPARTTVVHLHGTVRRWGRYQLGPVAVRTIACDGLLAAELAVLSAVDLLVYPASDLFDSDQPLPRATGATGVHRSRRAGYGGELTGVRPFQAGDRLRRINWRVTHRVGGDELYVNSTAADRDAEVLLVLDVRYEVGSSGGVDGPASVLDRTVRAAAAITEYYAYQGDRVALVEFGWQLRRLPARSGRQHHLAALAWLTGILPQPSTGGYEGGPPLADRVLPPGALVVMLTPLLDQTSANLLAVLARSGRNVVTVDTLLADAAPARMTPWTEAATGLWQLERANTIGRLREVGVPVTAWQGPGSLDEVLLHLNRFAAAPRLVAR